MDRKELKSTRHSARRLTIRRRSSVTLAWSPYETNVPLRRRRSVQGYILVWLDPNIDESDADYRNSRTQLRSVASTCSMFIDVDECVGFLTNVVDEKIFMIVSGFVGEYVLPVVQDIPLVDSVYVLCANVRRHETWAKKWTKVKGVFTEMNSICEILEQISHESNSTSISCVAEDDEDYLPIGFLANEEDILNDNLDELDPSFMFTKVLKEILLELEYHEGSMNELVTYCRDIYHENAGELNIIDDFERNYRPEMAIWWYTRESFTYVMLNRALRNLEVDVIIKMGFFLRDVHQQIVQLHIEQYNGHNDSKPFIVYRGQGLTQRDFHRLTHTKGGLMSFNNFLSTSRDRETAFSFTRNVVHNVSLVGILFVMAVSPSTASTPLAHISNVSYFKKEEETLFSMHSVFRIGEIKQVDENNRMYQVYLTLTRDNDEQLCALTERLREETRGSSGWDRIGKLLIKLAMFENAQHIYQLLVEQRTDDTEKAHFFHQLGYIKEDLGKYDDALSYYEKSLEIKQKASPSDRSHFAMYYNNVGSVYDKKGEYSTAVSFFIKAIEIFECILSPDDLRLATCYNNIGSVYYNLHECSTALFYYEKALAIDQKLLPASDPSLAIDYNNIGLVYHEMQDQSKAISYYEKTLDIYRRALQSDHPDFSIVYSNIGSVYNSMGENSQALIYYKKALKIDEKTLSRTHPSLGASYNNIGSVFKNMGDYSQALSMFERALDIEKCSQSPNQSRLQLYAKDIAFVKEKLEVNIHSSE